MTPSIPTPGSSRPGSSQRRTSSRQTARQEETITGTVPSGSSPPVEDQITRPFSKRELEQVDDLEGLYRIIGTVAALASRDVGSQIVGNSQRAAIEWVNLGRRNSKVKESIDSLTSASVWAKVVAIHMQMLAPAISIPFGTTPQTEEQDPSFIVMPDGVTITAEMAQEAHDMAMQMMGQRPMDTGGPGDTVRVPGNPLPPVSNGNGGPIGSADYKAPPMDPSEYPFPMDSSPPNA